MGHLRATTAQAHTDLENQVDIQAACKDADKYRNILAKFLGFYEPMEARLTQQDGWSAVNLDMEERRKIEWLKSDLRVLGLSDAEIDALPRCEEIPAMENFPQALGAAYVLEGATLGGRQITAWLKDTGIPEEARRFYASYGEKTGEQWKNFCMSAERYFGENGNGDNITRGANETFSALASWLSKSAAPAAVAA